jgi:hypothetical protein
MGRGGNGGGFVVICAREIEVETGGGIGSKGEHGVNAVPVSGGDSTQGVSGGGGGGGGTVLIKTVSMNSGTGQIFTNGGAGGTGRNDTSTDTENGGSGTDGFMRVEACSWTGSFGAGNGTSQIGALDWCSSQNQII